MFNDKEDFEKYVKGVVKDLDSEPVYFGTKRKPLDRLPKIFLYGDMTGISKSKEVKMQACYVYENAIDEECTLKYQGTSSLGYPKKNFTIKLKNKVNLGFGNQKKYCLKANYIDHSHARNIVSARLWSEIVKSRENYEELPEDFRNSPNNCVIDGYPIKLYLNGKYEGIYTLNVPKDAWMFGMDDSKDEHCVLCGENDKSGRFKETAVIDGTDWSDEIHDTVPASILVRWNEVIDFVKNSTDEEFKAGIDDYIDLQSLIDYYIYVYVMCAIDNMAKNQIYVTYDGQKWYASMYDMDSTWGLYWDGTKFLSVENKSNEDYWNAGENSYANLLYLRLSKLFKDEIVKRYDVLRSSVLSIKNIICKFEDFTDLITKELYEEDTEIYIGIPSKTMNNIKQIRAYANDRLAYVDKAIHYVETKLTDIALSSKSTFNVNKNTRLVTTMTPENANNYNLTYESSATDVATVDNTGLVTGVSQGTSTITVTDSVTGLSATLDITVGAEVLLSSNLIVTLDSSAVSDGAISTITKNGKNYTTETNGVLTVDETDNGIVFDGTQTFLTYIGNSEIAWDNPRTITFKFSLGNIAENYKCELLGHCANDNSVGGKMQWGLGHTGVYVKNVDGNIVILADVAEKAQLKETDNKLLNSDIDIHTLVTVYDKTELKYKIYMDSELIKETTEISSSGIKACYYVGNNTTENSFIGKIYELSVYNKALTTEEISSL